MTAKEARLKTLESIEDNKKVEYDAFMTEISKAIALGKYSINIATFTISDSMVSKLKEDGFRVSPNVNGFRTISWSE